MALDHLLREQGDDLLLESGGWILLESASDPSLRARVVDYSTAWVAVSEQSGWSVAVREASTMVVTMVEDSEGLS